MGTFKGIHYQTGKSIILKTENGLISSIEECNDKADLIISPGLFDNQVNGYNGVGFTKANLDIADIKKIAEDLHKIGVTSFLPTMITAPREILLRNLKIFRKLFVETDISVSTPGIHLEGPFLNPEDGYRGAHNPQWIRKPDIKEFDELYNASGGKITHITLAPELFGAIELIKHCRSLGLTVGMAHHNANAEQIHAAVEAGANLSIHLGNGLANTISRHNNPLWPQLSNDDLFISIISDGFHLSKDEIRTFYKVKGKKKTILTSDCAYIAGLPPGSYNWEDKKIILEPEGRIFFPEQQVLAGSAMPLISDIGIMMDYTGCTLSEAIDMASLNPARFHGVNDCGELEVGMKADMIMFQLENDAIKLRKTVKAGELFFEV